MSSRGDSLHLPFPVGKLPERKIDLPPAAERRYLKEFPLGYANRHDRRRNAKQARMRLAPARESVIYRCRCGEAFDSASARAIHQRQVHAGRWQGQPWPRPERKPVEASADDAA